MKLKRILSVLLVVATMLTFFVIPVSAEGALTNNSTISSDNILINDRITLDAFGSGGVEPYNYAYYYKSTAETTWHTIQGYSENASAVVALNAVGTYDLCVKIKDAVDTVAKKYFVATVSNGPLGSSSYLSTEGTFLGETITLNGVGIGGTMPYTYAFYYKKDNESNWHCLQTFQSNNNVNFTPQELGTYNICIKVHDVLNAEHKKYFQLLVQDPPFNTSFSVSQDNIWLGESIYMSALAEDGNPPYLYAFYAKHSTASNWTCLNTYSSNRFYTFTPSLSGTYRLCIKAKDSHNTEIKEYFDLTVHNELSAEDCYISSNKITHGEDITMVGRGKGGTGTYQYAFYYRKQGNSNWSCAQSFGGNSIKTFTPQFADKYDICIKVKDETDTVVKKYFYDVEVEEPGFYIHYYNYNNWQNVKIYYYNDGQGEAAQWPGVNMVDDGDGWYSYKITGYENAKVLFNDGGTNQIPATMVEGFYVDSDMWYRNGTQTDEQPDEITVYFYKPSNWSTPSAYYYLNSNDTGPVWPGVEMEEVSDNWYVSHISKYASAKVIFNDGTSQIPVQNQEGFSASGIMWYKNGVWCNATTDTDNDGLLDYQELLIGTNVNLIDTDGDALPDGYEVNILDTDPLDTDTDDNNISDGNEDADDDQLSNYEEYQNQTNPLSEDTDGDGLTDYEELYHPTYTTLSPINFDTDGDGAHDGWEIDHNTNPIIYNNTFTVQQSVEDQENGLSVNLTTTVEGEIVESINAEFQEDTFDINSSIPGYLGQAIKLTASDEIDSAVLSFTFDEDLLLDADFVPAIYYYNETTQCLEEISTTVNGHTATANLTHFSTYILLNKTDFESVWDNEIRLPSENASSRHLKVALVVDSSGSMSGNLSTTKSVLNQFVNVLQDDDQVALVTFADTASTICDFTTNTNTIQTAINNLGANGNTAIYAGISTAESLFNNSSNYDNLMIVITDGIDEPSVNYDTTYVPLIQSANNGVYNNNNELIRDHITIYTIGIGNNINTSLLNDIATGTHGSYYHATAISDLEDQIETIQEEIIDYTTDSNDDGISDYYTKQIVSGGLRYGTHAYVFRVLENGVYRPATLSEVQANADFDNDGLDNGDEIEVLVDTLGHPYIAFSSDPSNQDTDGDGYNDGEDLAVLKPYKNPVILIHGRNDNSVNCFGISNRITKQLNSGYNLPSERFTNLWMQSILVDEYNQPIIQTDAQLKNLLNEGYEANKNLFIFNYPNQDVAQVNANLLKQYIEHLITPTEYSNDYVDYSVFYPTQIAKNSKNIKFDLIGHSNGGLVARYYIENLGGHLMVDKLITIDTPHFGGEITSFSTVDILNEIDWICGPIDFELLSSSRLFTGNINIGFSMEDLLSITTPKKLMIQMFIKDLEYYIDGPVKYFLNNQSPQLNGNNNISTKYYAIGGLSYGFNVTGHIDDDVVAVDFDRNLYDMNTFLQNIINQAALANVNISLLSSWSGDNVIDIMTQFGLKRSGLSIGQAVRMNGTTAIITGNPRYNFIYLPYYAIADIENAPDCLWHCKILTSTVLLKTIKNFLGE